MKKLRYLSIAALIFCSALGAFPQGTAADYERARTMQERYSNAVVNLAGPTTWITGTSSFWYRKVSRGDSEIIRVDADTLTKAPAFDHARMAVAVSAATGTQYAPNRLPFGGAAAFSFSDRGTSIGFNCGDNLHRCDVAKYQCERPGPANTQGFNTPPQFRSPEPPPLNLPRISPDTQWEAFIRNFNLFVRSKDRKQEFALSSDGSEDNYYAINSTVWSPDSKKIAAYRVRPGMKRKIHFVESSPVDQMQPKYWSIEYAKPGDTVHQLHALKRVVHEKSLLLRVERTVIWRLLECRQ